MKVIFHPGFHKTGTSSLQAALRANRAALLPGIQIILSEDMPGLTGATKGYSVGKSPLDLGLVIYEAAQVAERITPGTRAVIVSSKSLCGQITGRNRIKDYGAAPTLLQTISAAFNEVIPEAEQTYVFSTRAPAVWLASCYSQHLRASRRRLSAQEYVSLFRPSSNLDKVAQDCKTVLALQDVSTMRVEDSGKTPLGLLDRLLDLAGTPATKRAVLVPVPPVNKAPTPAQVAALLDINQSDLNDKDARAARMKLNKGLT